MIYPSLDDVEATSETLRNRPSGHDFRIDSTRPSLWTVVTVPIPRNIQRKRKPNMARLNLSRRPVTVAEIRELISFDFIFDVSCCNVNDRRAPLDDPASPTTDR